MPQKLSYNNNSTEGPIAFSYQHGTLRMLGNKKYAKKEDRKGIRVVAIKITNNWDRTVTFNQDLKLYNGNNEVVVLAPEYVHQQLKQGVAIYLLYAPLTFTRLVFYGTDASGRTTVNSRIPIGLALGPGITIGNMAVAGTANKRFMEELRTYNLIGRQLQPGETVYGLIGVQDFTFNALSAKIVSQ